MTIHPNNLSLRGSIRPTKILVLILLSFLGAGCASLQTVEAANLQKGHERRFQAEFDQVVSAAYRGVSHLKALNVNPPQEVKSGTMILASRGVGMNTWGEYVRVFIERSEGALITVRVVSSKKLRVQLGGSGQRHYADAVFKNIAILLREG